MTIRTPNNSYYVSGASGGQNHTLPFGADRFEDDDLFVYVWNTSTEAWDKKTVTTHYTVSSTQVSFTSSHIPSTRVIVLRKTDVDEDFPKADFVAGASIKAQDLDNNQMQALRGIKELRDQKLSAVPSIAEDGTPSNPKMHANLDMNGYKVINQPAGHVTSTDILDGTIATADVADSAITAAKLASDSVTTAKIASDAVNGTKIADDSINSEHYVDGSIDTAHIADAQVTTAKIANDAVTADKLANTAVTAGSYTAADITVDAQGRVTAASSGTIGTSEIADDAVTTAKILDANVTTAKIADSAVTTAKIADAELVELATMGGNTASALADLTQSEVQILDGATVTTAELNILDGVTATATELNQLDGNTLKTSSTDFTSSSQFPAASEIDARITARIDPLGGFEAIADEDSFPATAPPAGTVVSIANANGLAVNGSGVGAGTRAGGSDAVVINGFPSTFNSTSLDNGIGLLVIATSTAHTYDFHRVVAKNEDVRQLSSDINDFKARYRIGSSNPTTDNDAGDLFFNTGTSKMLVYNATSSAWEEVQAVGDFFINTLSSSSGTGGGSATFNGSAYRFTLSNAPTYAQQLLVSINGVVQKPNSGTSQPSEGFAIDGGDIILAAAPATGSNAFFITIGSSVSIGTPSDNTISTAKIVDGAVTNAKVSSSAAIASSKLAKPIDFADSEKARFGNSQDLQIYHSGTNSFIDDTGTGQLAIRSSDISFEKYTGEQLAKFTADDSCQLYHNNDKKLETKPDGIDVTGEVQCDSLDVDGNADISGDINISGGNKTVQTTAGFLQVGTSGSHHTAFITGGSERMRVDTSGNVGIGTSSPAALCHIHKTSGTTLYRASVAGNSTIGLEIVKTGATTQSWRIADGQTVNGKLEFYDVTDSATRMCIDGSGNIGIGTTNPGYKLEITESSANSLVRFDGANSAQLVFRNATSNVFELNAAGGSDELSFGTAGNNERLRIDSSGNVGIGTSSPSGLLHISCNTCQMHFTDVDDSSSSRIYQSGSTFAIDVDHANAKGSSALAFRVDDSERMRIDDAGIIFLGNSSSTENTIANTNQAAKAVISGGGGGCAVIEVHGASHSSDAKVITMDTDSSERFRIAANGRITAQVIYGTPLSGTTRDVFIEDGGQLGYISSVRDSKANINLLSNVDWIYQLQPSSFNYKLTDQEGAYTGEVNPELEYGLIAEDVEPVAPELCFYDEVDGEQELRGVHYKKLIVPMLKALQEAVDRIENLETQNASLEARLTALEGGS